VEPSRALEEVGIGISPATSLVKFKRRKMLSIGDQTSAVKTKMNLSDVSDLEDDLNANSRRELKIADVSDLEDDSKESGSRELQISDVSVLEDDPKENGKSDASITQDNFQQFLDKYQLNEVP
jgi:hypothetical protein